MKNPFSKKKDVVNDDNKKKDVVNDDNKKKDVVNDDNKKKDVKVKDTEKDINSKEVKDFAKNYKDTLLKGSVTREDIIREIQNAVDRQKDLNNNRNDPFKTRDDIYIDIYNDDNSIRESRMPFEKIKIKGQTFYYNKTFENFEIKINYIFAEPQSKIDFKEEFSKRHETQKRLDKINQKLSFIDSKVSSGFEEYSKLDYKDLVNEKLRLENILEIIRLGPSQIRKIQDSTNMRWKYEVKRVNGVYYWIRESENGRTIPDYSAKASVIGNIVERVTDIAGVKKSNALKYLIGTLLTIVILFFVALLAFKTSTFDAEEQNRQINIRVEQLLDTACQGYIEKANTFERFIEQQGLTPPRVEQDDGLEDFERAE